MQEKKLEKNSKTGVSPLVLSQAAAVLQKRRSYASFRAPKGSLDLVWCGWSAIRGSAGLAAGLWACCWACGLTAGPAAASLQKRRSYASFRAPKGSLDLVWCGWSAIRGSAGLAAGPVDLLLPCGLAAGPMDLVAHFFFYSFSFSALVCT
uniref:Uncharacterized protein n=1 Tax=Fagus sylvatica TaxID=28930 RepID=A0A2N9I910_FAGSY